MKKSTTKVTIIMICLIVLVVVFYAYLSNKEKAEKAEAVMTPVQEALNRDLLNDYPATPKEVVKYYNQLLVCFYNEECTDEEITDLGQRARDLYDEELLEVNQQDTYMTRLRGDIQDYKDNKRRITSSAVAASTSVVYDTLDGHSFARILCGYNINENGQNNSLKQVYLLRRDEDKRWKIYGWEDSSMIRE